MRAYFRTAAMMKERVGFINAILHEQPRLRGKEVVVPMQGSCSHVIFIEDEVFKGPNSTPEIACLEQEIFTLQKLAGSGLPVPEITCIGHDAIFVGMKRIKGLSLRACGYDISYEQKDALVKDVVDTLIGISEALPKQDGRYTTHDDLNDGNVLLDPHTFKLKAVIDFGVMSTSNDHLGTGLHSSSLCFPCFKEYAQRHKTKRWGLS